MASYVQWARGKRSARVLWVCGPEDVLRRSVILACKQSLPEHAGYSAYFPDLHGEATIWAALMGYTTRPHLAVVWHADELRDFGAMERFLEAAADLPQLAVVFFAYQDHYAVRELGSRKQVLLPGPALVQSSSLGQIVFCQASEGDKVQYLSGPSQGLPSLPEHVARQILAAAGGDLSAAMGAKVKLSASGEPVTAEAIGALTGRPAMDRFVDALVHEDKAAALAAIPAVESLGFVIGSLNHQLDVLGTLHVLTAEGKTAKEVAERLGNWALPLRSACRSYDFARVRSRRRLLAVVDSAYRDGARNGVAEALVALW